MIISPCPRIAEIKEYNSGMKISEILHLAADKYLRPDRDYYTAKTLYSCVAIAMAQTSGICVDLEPWAKYNPEFKNIMQGLCNMGFKTKYDVGTIFIYCDPYERQQRRYSWLKFAAMMAEEQGV